MQSKFPGEQSAAHKRTQMGQSADDFQGHLGAGSTAASGPPLFPHQGVYATAGKWAVVSSWVLSVPQSRAERVPW